MKWDPAGRTRPEQPTLRGPSSCPWEPGPLPKTVPIADSSGSLRGNHREARKLPGGISSTASWFFEVTSLAWGKARGAWAQGWGREGGWGTRLFSGLKLGSARGSGDPWTQAQLRRHVDTWHSHTQTHSRGYARRHVSDKCVFVWAHAQTCSSSHSHISKNTQMDPCGHELADMLRRILGGLRYTHVPQTRTDPQVHTCARVGRHAEMCSDTRRRVWTCTFRQPQACTYTEKCSAHGSTRVTHRHVQTHTQTAVPTSSWLRPLSPGPGSTLANVH